MLTLPHVCVHCNSRVVDLGRHLRDAGDVDVCPPWSCPALFELRKAA